MPPPASGIQRDRLDYSIRELVGAHYIGFIDQAFRSILKRPPDEAGMHVQVRLLAGGASKAEILGNLRWSAEGRRIGTRIKGLPARYLLAKAARLPVLGYFVDWAIALAGLPLLLRHQRAADTSVEARFGAQADALRNTDARTDALQRALAERADALHQDIVRLAQQLEHLQFGLVGVQQRLDALEPRAAKLETDADATGRSIIELTHFVHANNHWVASLQRSLSDIDELARSEDESAGVIAARVVERVDDAVARNARYLEWSTDLARRLPVRTRVLDLGSGNGSWIEAMRAQGLEADGVEPVAALAGAAQARALPVAAGDPRATLARCEDASVSAITLAPAALVLPASAAISLLSDVTRVLSRDGWLLLRLDRDPHRLAGGIRWDAQRWRELLVAAGFGQVGILATDSGNAVVACRRS